MSPGDVALLERLHELLVGSHSRLGQTIDRIDPDTEDRPIEVYRCGQSGVIAFIGDYVLTGWERSDLPGACREAYQILHERLKVRGFTYHMVYPLNARSVILTRRLGAKPTGVDADGYVHYILTLEAFEEAAAKHHH